MSISECITIPTHLIDKDSWHETLLSKSGQEYLVRKSGNICSVFDIHCPHQGHKVVPRKEGYVCTGHGWQFESSGCNKIKNHQGLLQYKATLDNNEITFEKFQEIENLETQNNYEDLQIRFITHACLEFTNSNYRLITDPWITKSTYWGNWVQWPPFNTTLQKDFYSPSAILITHEHPDHFDEKSIDLFNRKTPIYFPSFASGRIRRSLQRLGFNEIFETRFDELIELQEKITFKFIRPSSRWEDSVLYLNFAGFSWLNLNDAGYVGFHDKLPRNIDLLSAAFDIYATDFPLCWENISEEKKRDLARASKKATLNHLSSVCNTFSAKYLLPIASFWRLRSHESLPEDEKLEHVKLVEINEVIDKSNTTFLDLLPGELWIPKTGQRESQWHEEQRIGIRNGDLLFREYYDFPVSNDFDDKDLTEEEIYDFKVVLLELESLKSAFNTESATFRFLDSKQRILHESNFALSESDDSNNVVVSVELPNFLVREFSKQNATFESMRIGYWLKFSRNKDFYTPNILRLLALGRQSDFGNESWGSLASSDPASLLHRTVGSLVEGRPQTIANILNRWGLPCTSCNKLNMETLETAFQIHNINRDDQSEILRQIGPLA